MAQKIDIRLAWSLMNDIRICMLVDHDRGKMRARPMSAIPDAANNAIWFFTDVGSHKDDELLADGRVCLVFQSPEEGLFLSVSGAADVMSDKTLIDEKWNEEADLWFPKGPADPNVCLLRVKPEMAEYWRRPHGFSEVAAEVRRACHAGEEANIGDNARVSFIY